MGKIKEYYHDEIIRMQQQQEKNEDYEDVMEEEYYSLENDELADLLKESSSEMFNAYLKFHNIGLILVQRGIIDDEFHWTLAHQISNYLYNRKMGILGYVNRVLERTRNNGK